MVRVFRPSFRNTRPQEVSGFSKKRFIEYGGRAGPRFCVLIARFNGVPRGEGRRARSQTYGYLFGIGGVESLLQAVA